MSRLLSLFLLLASTAVCAHEVRPGYLELTEQNNGTYQVLWKVPVNGPVKLRLAVTLPDKCHALTPVSSHVIDAARIDRWQTECPGGIAPGEIFIEGLQNTITDVLLRVQHAGGSTETVRLTPTQPGYLVQGEQGFASVAATYFVLGVEHILIGIDHLLFVLVLLLLVLNWRRLIFTITAFTIAHSITLALSALELVSVPQAPVEAVIALSIMFVAIEVVHRKQGRYSLTANMPWIAAFAFGLLHGFGFAGALHEIGLPQHAIPLALALFNIGVEAGQLIFIGAFFIMTSLAGRLLKQADSNTAWRVTERIAMPAAYITGSLACFWTIERTASFWT